MVGPLLEPVPRPTEAAHAAALQLLDRYGVVTREAVLAESVVGGFSGVYGVLKVLEERGQVRRGYFVAGQGAAQFAAPGAVDRLRSVRDDPDPLTEHPGPALVLAATDPAQPYGAALPWPESPGRPARSANALVVLGDGSPLAWIDMRSHHLVTFPRTAEDGRWAAALAGLVERPHVKAVEVRKVDGSPIADGPVRDHLRAAGFADGYRGPVIRSR